MATGKVVGHVQVTIGNIKIVGVDGAVREPEYGGSLYEGEQVVSADSDALFQIKYTALPEATAYDGVFRVLADGSVIAGVDAMDSIMSDKSLADIFDLETAAGEESVESNSAFIPSNIVAESSVQGFGRGPNPGLADGGVFDATKPFLGDLNDFAPTAEDASNSAMEDDRSNVTGKLIGADRDGNTFTFVLIDGPSEGSLVLYPDGRYVYNVEYDFQDLGVGETRDVTFTFKTVEATTSEGYESEPATVTITVAGTNDQPVVENIVLSAYETHDILNWWDANRDGNPTNDDFDNMIFGKLVASDDDVNDNHVFGLLDMSLMTEETEETNSRDFNGHNHTGGAVQELIDIEYDINGYASGGHGTVKALFESSAINAGDVDFDKIFFYDNNGNDSDTLFSIKGDFSALGAGETATITFKYYADDDSGVGAGDTFNEQQRSEPKIVTITITGTNDQPTVENVAISAVETYDLFQWWDANRDGNPTNDDFDNMIFGKLVASDDDVNDDHVFSLTDMYLPRQYGGHHHRGDSDKELVSVAYDINGFSHGGHGSVDVLFESSAINAEDIDLEKIFFYDNNGRDSDTRFSLQGDFSALGAGETATITFKYYATDTSSGSEEPNESEAKLVTITITGTNDQPTVERVEISAYETHDENPWDDWTHVFPFYNPDEDNGVRLNDEYKNWVKGTLSAIDEDVNDKHTFSLSDMRGGTIIEDVNYDTNGYKWGGTGRVDVRFNSSYVNADDITVDAILLSSDNGRDSDTDFYLVGDFNALGAGETATITFKYYATDSSSGSQEPNESAARTVSVTVIGTNDQPVVSDINVNSQLSTVTFVQDDAGYANVLGIYQLDSDGNPTNPQYILLNSDSANNGDILGMFDFSDPELQYFIIPNGAGLVSADDILAFNSSGELTRGGAVVASVIYSEADKNGGESSMIVQPLSDGSIKISFDDQLSNIAGDDNDFNDIVINVSNIIYESTSTGNIFLDYDNSDVMTTFSGNLATAQDDDVNDTHTYQLVGGVDVTSDDVDTSLFSDISVLIDAQNGNYTLSGNFNALAAGDTATVTFQYAANDGTSDSYGETNLSDPKTVTLTITGTNDAPTAMSDNVTVVSDTISNSEIVFPIDISSFTYDGDFENSDMNNTENSTVRPYSNAYAVDDQNSTTTTQTVWVHVWGPVWIPQTQEVTTYDADDNRQIDSAGDYNEGIVFAFSDEVSKATVVFDNNSKAIGKDEVGIRVYNEDGDYRVVDTSELSGNDQTIDIEFAGFNFDRVVIYALEPQNPGFDVSEFRVESVDGVYDAQTDTLFPFIIDDAALLANDSDMDDGDELEVGLGSDTNLYLGDTDTVVGSVSLDENGDILVTPNEVEFEDNTDGFARFDYTIDDGNGGVATATATIDVRLGTLVEGETYDSSVDNILVVEDSLDLSDVSNISVIQLDGDATIMGSVDGINAADVIGATGDNNTLYITSLDNNASNQVNVDTTSLSQIENVNIDGVDYTSYSDGIATLLIEIDEPIDVV